MKNLEERIQQASRGKEIFKKMFEADRLSTEDTFLIVLTDNTECIHYGIDYLSDFIKLYNRRNVYILLEHIQYVDLFSKAGGNVKICGNIEIQCLAAYLNIFHKKDDVDTRIIFLTEKDGYGLPVEELLEKKEFTLEEYIAISLYRLENLKVRRG